MDRSRSGKIGGRILLMEDGFFIVADHPASPSLDFPERLFSLRRFQRDGGIAGFGSSLRYWATHIGS
jgi:hypothetical protein